VSEEVRLIVTNDGCPGDLRRDGNGYSIQDPPAAIDPVGCPDVA
jgi:hypothetical protein